MSVDSNYSQQPVPLAACKGVLVLSMVMLGLTSFSASMWTDGVLGADPSYDDFFPAVLLGNLMLGLYTTTLGFIGACIGLSTHLLTHHSFDSEGSWLPSMLLGGTQTGWSGVDVTMFAIPVAKVTGLDANLLIPIPGVLTTPTVFFDIAGLILLSAIAVPVIVVLGSYSIWLVVRDAGGLTALQQVTSSVSLSFSTVIAPVVSSFASADILTTDSIRFGRSACTAVVMHLVVFFLGNSLMFIFGAVGAAAAGKPDISDVMIAQGLLIPAIPVPSLDTRTINDNALYVSGLGFINITSLSNCSLAILNSALSTLVAPWLYSHFVDWLTFLFATTLPIGGAAITDYLSRRRYYRQHPCVGTQATSWVAVLAVVCGTVADHWLPGAVPVNIVLGVAITYLLLNPLPSRNPNKPEETLHAD